MIVVIGAGIAGLAAALTLARFGEVRIVERRSAVAANAGAGIQLSPNAMKALAALGAAEAATAAASMPDGLCVGAPNAERPLVRVPYQPLMQDRYGAPYLTASRAALHGALLGAVRSHAAITIIHGRAVTAVRDDARGSLSVLGAGIDDPADLVVAADGVNSVVRHDTVGDAAHDSGWIAWRGRARTAGRDTMLTMGAGHHLVRYALDDDDANCVLIARETSRGPASLAQGPTGALIADVAQWTPWPVRVRPRHVFARGRIAFIGDAAHAMLPFLAQGAAMALEDAAVLGCAVERHGLTAAAVTAYGSDRAPRTVALARQSERQGLVYHLPFPLDRARNAAMRRLGVAGILARVDPIYGWAPP